MSYNIQCDIFHFKTIHHVDKNKKKWSFGFKKFRFRCVLGKLGIKKNKKEGDQSTPGGIFSLGKLYYRSDRIKKIETHLKCKVIKKYMGWCNNPNDRKYNKEFNLNSKKKVKNYLEKIINMMPWLQLITMQIR